MSKNANKKKTTLNIIIAVFFITWFIASLVGLIWAGNSGHGSLIVVLIGQYLAVFGTIAAIVNYRKLKELEARRKASRRAYKFEEDEEERRKKFNPDIFFPVLIAVVGFACVVIGLLLYFGYIHID